MGGELIETEARAILNQGKREGIRENNVQNVEYGKLTIREIAVCSELSMEEVEQLVGLQAYGYAQVVGVRSINEQIDELRCGCDFR